MSSFENLRIVDNFYQTSLYYPMPTVVISTLAEDGSTSLGPYSLIAPYYVAGKGYYAMLLNCRNSSNTAQHILRTGKCAINFINDDPKNFKEAVKLSWPGDEPKDKMPNCKFPLEKSQIMEENPDDVRPMVISNAIQVLECTWMRELDGADRDQPGELHGYEPPYHDFNGITSQFGAHFILRIDRILMKKKYSDAIIAGVKSRDFPPLPIDYGYRDSKNFWFHRHRRMRAELLPIREASLESVRYAADRADDKVKFTDDALKTILNVPRVFLPLVLKGCVDWAKENGVELVTEEHMKIINDKHYQRIQGLIAGEHAVFGGQARDGRIAPTLLDGITGDSPIMQEEIFGPVLPMMTFEDLDQVIAFITSRPKPLALYLFTTDHDTERTVLERVSFGGGCVNDTIIHLATPYMPFGGVGTSGMGGYHGKYSFDTFTHYKSVLKKANWLDLPMRYQPYTDGNFKLLKMFLK